jgi:hypothetical protein
MARHVLSAIVAAALAVAAILLIVGGERGGRENTLVHETVSKEKAPDSSSIGGLSMEDQSWDKLPSSVYTKRDVPRMDFKFKKVPKTFCGGDNYTMHQKCSKEYKESLVMTALPVMIVALITILIMTLVILGRNCCCIIARNGCCGGKIPSTGCCFGERLGRDDGYTPYRRRVYLFAVISILVLVGVAMAVGFTGNTQMAKGVDKLLHTLNSIPLQVRRQITYIDAELKSLKTLSEQTNPGVDVSLWNDVSKNLKTVDTSVASLQTDAKKGSDTVHKYEKQREAFLKWAFISAPIVAGIGVLAYLLPSLLTIIVIPLVILICVLCWIVIGVHMPVAVATADFCVDLDHALKNPNASMGAIDMVLKCGGKGGASNILASGDTFISQSYSKACTELTTKLCKTPAFNYTSPNGNEKTMKPVTCPNIACNKQTLNLFMNQTIVADFKFGCAKLISGSIGVNPGTCIYEDRDVAKKKCLANHGIAKVIPCTPTGGTSRNVNLRTCAKSCYMTNTTKAMSSKIVGNYDILSRFDLLKTKRLQPLLQCKIIRAGVSKLEHTLCWDVVNATDYIIAGLAIIGITFFFGTAAYLGAQKVFNRKYWDVHYPDTYDKETSDDPDAETAMTKPLISEGVKTDQ